MSECAAITVFIKEELFLLQTFLYITHNRCLPYKPSVLWSSDSRRSEKYNAPPFLLFLSSLSLIFQALYTKAVVFKGDQRA